MAGTYTEPRLSAPVTRRRKGDEEEFVESPKQHQHYQGNPEGKAAVDARVSESPKRPPVTASRSMSSGSSVSESASLLSSSGTESSMATDASSRVSGEDDDDEKSSGHTVVGQNKKSGSESPLQLAGEQDAAKHSDSTRPTPSTLTSSPAPEPSAPAPLYYSQLPVASQQLAQRQARTKPTRHNSLARASSPQQVSGRDQFSNRAASGGEPASSSSRPYSTSPRQTLSRSYTTSAVATMAAGIHSAHTGTSPPPQFPSTSGVAPPVQNSASVTSTRARAYSTSASGLASPTSPAVESMTFINAEAMRMSPPGSSASSASPPSAPLSSHHALVNATTSPPLGSAAWKSSSTGGHEPVAAAPSDPSASSLQTSSSAKLASFPAVPSHSSSAISRRHSVDPYSQRNPSNNNNQNNVNQQTPAAGHRRHHQSISVPPSSNEYSSLGDHQAQNHQAHHLLQLSSRYRKSSLGSQTLLSNSTADSMTSPPASSTLNSAQSGSASSERRQQQRDRANYPHGDPGGGPQLSPTRSRTDPYMSTSPRYSSRASHDAQRNNQLEAKIVLLGRQGVGKTSLVHRYITGKFSSSLPMTIGASFLVKKLDFEGGIKVRLQIWDTAGQERFRSMAPMYYRGAHAAILVYDITNDESLSDIQVWLDELRQNMSSDLIVHIVGNKADLAQTSRKITLEEAQRQISEWIARPASGVDASTLSVPPARRSTSGGHSSHSRSADEGSPSTARHGMVGLGSFNLSRSGSRQKASEELEPALPAFKDWGLEEVSAKEDDGIDMLFATIAGKLVERKNQIEQERVLRTKDSIMITDEMKGKSDDLTRVWGCC